MFAFNRATKLEPGPTNFVLMLWKLDPWPHNGFGVCVCQES